MGGYDSKKVSEIHRQLHSHLLPESVLRVKALESLLVEKGLITRNAL
jgi:nitrile hydratase